MIPSALFCFLKIVLAMWGYFCFHEIIKIICFSSVKSPSGVLIGIALNPLIVLGSMVILIIFILPIREQGISFSVFVSCLISY